jgi:hypothetical protein
MPAALPTLDARPLPAYRLQVGPTVTVVFEDPSAVWVRAQQLARAGLRPTLGRRSGGGRLVGTVLVAEPGRRPGPDLLPLRQAIAAGRVGFRSDAGRPIPGILSVSRSPDPLVGLALSVTILFADTDRAAFADPRPVWRLAVEADGYSHAGEPLGWAVRAGLLEDLGERP